MRNSNEKMVAGLLKERLSDYKDQSFYGCDLAYTLFEGENAIMEQKKFIVEQIELLQAERDNLGSSEKDELKFEQLSNDIDKLLLKFKKIATSTEYSALVLVL